MCLQLNYIPACLRYRDNHRCLFLAVPANKRQFFLIHTTSLLINFFRSVLLSEHPETLATNQ